MPRTNLEKTLYLECLTKNPQLKVNFKKRVSIWSLNPNLRRYILNLLPYTVKLISCLKSYLFSLDFGKLHFLFQMNHAVYSWYRSFYGILHLLFDREIVLYSLLSKELQIKWLVAVDSSFWKYRISSYSFRPWIVSAHLCTVTFEFPNSKKNSFRGNYMRKYGISIIAVCRSCRGSGSSKIATFSRLSGSLGKAKNLKIFNQKNLKTWVNVLKVRDRPRFFD